MSKLFSLDAVPFDPNTVTLVCGYFDLLHAGHVSFFEACKLLGGTLVVGVYSDEVCKRIKAPDRPIINESDRAYIISCLECVDFVYINKQLLDENDGYVLKKIRPKRVVFSIEAEKAAAKGKEESYIKAHLPSATIVYIPRQRSDISTTEIKRWIRNDNDS